MRRNFILLAALAIFSMVVRSHTAISFPQSTSSELISPYCNATSILEAFLHDVIASQSCAPTELTRDAIYYKATTISKNAKNMSWARDATPKLWVAYLVLTLVSDLELFMLYFAIGGLIYRFMSVQCLLKNWMPEAWMLPTLWKLRTTPEMEYILKEAGIISYRHVSTNPSLDIYLLKEAFEELERHPRILEDPNFYKFATLFLLAPSPRAAFVKIPDDRRFDWLNNRYRDDKIIGHVWPRLLA